MSLHSANYSRKSIYYKELITVRQVAEKLQLPLRTVQRLLRTGKLLGFQIGRKWYMRERDLDRAISYTLKKAKISLQLEKNIS